MQNFFKNFDTDIKKAMRDDNFVGVTSHPLNVKLLKAKIMHLYNVNSLRIDFTSPLLTNDE